MHAFILLDINMPNVLGGMFIAIFAITAILTLLSLPNWINIGEWYRKKLFLALIIEVVALVLLIGRNELLKDNSPKALTARIGPNESLRPAVKPGGNICVISSDSVELGTISPVSFERMNFFTRINSSADDAEKNDVVKWESAAGSTKWVIARGKEMTNPPFALDVRDVGQETVYVITNTVTGEEKFNSGTYHKEGLFDLENRMTHFYGHDNTYCLFRIISSELTKGKKRHVHVLQVKLDPALVAGDLKVTRNHGMRNSRRDSTSRGSSAGKS